MGVNGMESFREMELVFEQYWNEKRCYIVMPFTIRARSYLTKVVKDIEIKVILDNNPELNGTCFKGIPIQYAGDFFEKEEKGKILISSHYSDIAEQLERYGYRENIDFIDMHIFVSLWYWKNKKELHFLDIHTAITTYCTLNCRNCNMFMNYYKNEVRRNISFEEFKDNFDKFFRLADFCYKVSILGGEPFLNKDLPQMIQWLYQTYNEKIGEIVVVSNGTVLPSETVLESLLQAHVKVSVSDYTASIAYSDRIEKLENVLRQRDIVFERNREMKWKDFYFPERKQGAEYTSVREHMMHCNPVFRGLNDHKFYYCHIVWSAVQAGLLKEEKSDYVSLEEYNDLDSRRKLLEHDLGFVENGYVTMCRYCGGCGSDNESIIDAGVQDIRREMGRV